MQKLTISGHLGRDLSLKETTSGERFYVATMAVNSRVRGAEKTTWYDIMTFNVERYKNMSAYLTKGTSVIVSGDLDVSIQKGNDGVTRPRLSVVADTIEFGGGSSSGNTETNATKVVTETVDDEKPAQKKVTKSKVKTTVVDEVPDDISMNASEPQGSNQDTGDDLPF